MQLAAMLGLSQLKHTRYYQDVELETKLGILQRLLPMGLTLEQIAQAIDLPVEVVQKNVQKLRREFLSVAKQNKDFKSSNSDA